MRNVRIVVAPWVFRIPGMRRFAGYTAWNLILLRSSPGDNFRLVVHELCHVWQMQHHPIMPLSFLRTGYAANRMRRRPPRG